MTRNYARKNNARSGTMFKQVSIAFVSMVIGYLAAIICDANTFKMWFGQHVLTTQNPQPVMTASAPDAPKPKLEFYTLLTKENAANGSAQVAVATVPPNPAPTLKTEQAVAETQQIDPQASTPAAIEKKPVIAASPAPVVVGATVKVSTPIDNRKNTFVVQIAAFKNMRDAEKLRATLVMKGFDVAITSVNQASGSWYRVMMGPFPSRLEAQRAQTSMVKSERIVGMIRKVDV